MKPLRILIADDHEVVRQGVRALIEGEKGWEVCGVADTGREAVLLTEQLEPDIVILDMNMPGLNGLEAARQIKRLRPATEILIFTGEDTDALIRRIFEAGAKSFVLKSDAGKYLIEAIQALAQHKPFFTKKASDVVFARFAAGAEKPAAGRRPDHDRLSPRERELVQLLAEGKSNKETAGALGISTRTAEVHRAAILRKLNIKSLPELVRYAIRNHVIQP